MPSDPYVILHCSNAAPEEYRGKFFAFKAVIRDRLDEQAVWQYDVLASPISGEGPDIGLPSEWIDNCLIQPRDFFELRDCLDNAI
jgi:hypothetical protein